METLAEFTARMSEVEKDEELIVGSAHRGHTRAVFTFEGQVCFLESHTSWNILMSARDYWWTDFEVKGEDLAMTISEKYNGNIEANFHGKPDVFHFVFNSFEDLMGFVYARHSGELTKQFGV